MNVDAKLVELAESESEYWFATLHPTLNTVAYDVAFNVTNVVPAMFSARNLGFSVLDLVTVDYPLTSFVRSGYVYSTAGSVRFGGRNGIISSASAFVNSPSGIYYFNLDQGAGPSDHGVRVRGLLGVLTYTTMSFVRSGYVYVGVSSLINTGVYGRYWSSASFPTNNSRAFHLSFDRGNLDSTDNVAQVSGFYNLRIDYNFHPFYAII